MLPPWTPPILSFIHSFGPRLRMRRECDARRRPRVAARPMHLLSILRPRPSSLCSQVERQTEAELSGNYDKGCRAVRLWSFVLRSGNVVGFQRVIMKWVGREDYPDVFSQFSKAMADIESPWTTRTCKSREHYDISVRMFSCPT